MQHVMLHPASLSRIRQDSKRLEAFKGKALPQSQSPAKASAAEPEVQRLVKRIQKEQEPAEPNVQPGNLTRFVSPCNGEIKEASTKPVEGWLHLQNREAKLSANMTVSCPHPRAASR